MTLPLGAYSKALRTPTRWQNQRGLMLRRLARASMRPLTSLASDMVEFVADGRPWNRLMYDLFISHASEDKETIAQPLTLELRGRGYRVWLDRFELKLGDSLSRTIDRGLADSKYGAVILSKYFFAKKWPERELSGLVYLLASDCRALPTR
jgi:hypothetical protein